VVRVRVEATQEEIALINQAARKLGLTASQFVTRAVTIPGSKQTLHKIAGHRYSSSGKTKLPRRKRKS
jgi:hypothetical protein